MRKARAKTVKKTRKTARAKSARRPDGEGHLDTVVSNAPIILFAFDARGVFTISKGKALEGLGLAPGDAVGRTILELYGDNPRVLDDCRRALKGELFTDTVEVSGRLFETRYCPQKGPGGRIVGVVGVATDVTDQLRVLELEKKARADAEAASHAKDEFLAVVSHELRTPMTAILGWTWLLRSGEVAQADFGRALDVIERNMKMQAQIIEDLLDMSTIVTGKLQLDRRPVDLNLAIDDALEALRPSAEARRLTIDDQRKDGEVLVLGDRQRLKQVFWNLLSNAVKFNRDAGLVRLNVSVEGREAVVRIEDNGEGIPEDFLPSLFDPLRQAESSLTRRHRGLGIGLAIVRHLIAMHGGRVSAHSEGRGRGSRFTVALPLASAAEPAKAAPGAPPAIDVLPHSLDLMRILLVDDEPDTISVLTELLRYCGAQVHCAGSAKEAMALLPQVKPDIVISDIAMPQEDGYSFMRRVRALPAAKGGEVPALALTACASSDDKRLALEAGFQFYLAKPVEPGKLVAALRSLPRNKHA